MDLISAQKILDYLDSSIVCIDQDMNIRQANATAEVFFDTSESLLVNKSFSDLFTIKDDSKDVIIDFTNSRVMDHSALVAINDLADKYGEAGKRVHLRHLSPDCAQLLAKIHEGGLPPYEIIEADDQTDPVYAVAENSELYEDVGLSN